MVAHVFNPSYSRGESEPGLPEQVPGQLGLQGETLSQKPQNK